MPADAALSEDVLVAITTIDKFLSTLPESDDRPSLPAQFGVFCSALMGSPADINCAIPSETTMAKRQGTVAATEHRIEDFAEDLGKMLGHARNKAEGWLSQRDAIVKNLTQLRDEATKLLAQLGPDASSAAERGVRILRGRPLAAHALVVNKLREEPVRKRRKMSKAARAKISAAQKARWAKQKSARKS